MQEDTASGEYAAILGAKPEKYQKKVLLFQVRLRISIFTFHFM